MRRLKFSEIRIGIMILQIPTSVCISYNFLEKEIAWGINILLTVIAAIIMLSRAKSSKSSSLHQYKIFRGYGLFALGMALGRIFFILSDIEKLLHGTEGIDCVTPLHTQFVLLSYFVGIMSALSLISMIETNLLNLKKRYLTRIFQVLGFTAGILVIFAQFAYNYLNLIRTVNMAFSTSGVAVLMYLYIKAIKLTTGVLRRNSIMVFLSIVLIFLGTVLDSELIINSLSVPIWFPAIFPAVGILLLIRYQRTS